MPKPGSSSRTKTAGTTTRARLEAAQEGLASSAGELSLMLATGRGLTRQGLRDMVERVRRAAELLETVAGD